MDVSSKKITEQRVWEIVQTVCDPEIPVLTITDLGIVRSIEIKEDDFVEIIITPTYSGCPAMDMINMELKLALIGNGIRNFKINTVLSPAWTTDWMTEDGKKKLREYGIAPPNPMPSVCSPGLFAAEEAVQCPHCQSYHTERISEFGSTACKALYKCLDCKEPFDYFKCH